ncbi:transmembrane protein, putative (macronuclear) [Tetrahymena thermophila SB210]|uniref:Transmembrane protein, putative n=1 Tax=Tetrahymena thermophila (strain SB210) TaxID=312017 RepID=I7M6T6_TETTS|nr:transmembrane protein, putative [Tetrahymena thermophila SB210]EAR86096.2 transmembrane protein, putative [Tetrahymena thermophila SB210]|eukprot:XP_976691.2 transmembrane protein, putative [Tetrahymena thermophila SB210]
MENQIPLIDEENQLSSSNNIQTSVEDFYFLIQNLTYEEFLQQNFERVKLYSENDNKKYQTAFQHLDVILNQKICMYQQKEEQPIQKILQTKGNAIKILPNQVNLRMRYTPRLDGNLNIPQIELELTQQQEHIQDPYQMKGLSKQQLKQIKDFGYFYVQLNNSIEKWKIQESFYTPKSSRKYSNQLQALKQSLTKSLKILYNEQNILDYKNLRKIEFEDFSIKNISLLQGVIGVINIPYQLFGLLFGVPILSRIFKEIIKHYIWQESC